MNILNKTKWLGLSLTAALLSISVQAQQLTAREVAKKYDDVLRETHTSLMVQFQLSTCKYRIKGTRMVCSERPRVRVFENTLKYFGNDSRSIAIVLEPARDKGIGSLTHEFYDINKDNASWIYLSALGKVKRVIASRDSEDSASFFGSEFSLEDFEWRRLNEYTFKILGEEQVRVPNEGKIDTHDAYMLEWTPTAKRMEKSRYNRIVSWVDKERFILLKEDYYDSNDNLSKKRTLKNIKLIDNNWLARHVTMNNLQTNRVSILKRQKVAVNVPIDDEYLTERALTDFAFRERYLTKYRKYFE